MTARVASFLAGLAFVVGNPQYHLFLRDLIAETGDRLLAGYMEIN